MTKKKKETFIENEDLESVADYYEHIDTSAEMEEGEWIEPRPMKTTSLRLPSEVVDALKARARAKGMRYTAFVREILEQAVSDSDSVTPNELARVNDRLSRLEAFLVDRPEGQKEEKPDIFFDRQVMHQKPTMTIEPERTILAIVRSVSSTNRLLDALAPVISDQRIRVIFTVEQVSSESADPNSLLVSLGTEVLPWERAIRANYDLAISAHSSQRLKSLKAPRIILIHRLHRNCLKKLTDDNEPAQNRNSGPFFKDWQFPTTLGLARKDQYGVIESLSPSAARRSIVVGDSRFDRITAHLPYRGYYREALGAGERRFILVSSTWGQDSLLAQDPSFVKNLVNQLPRDRYQIALIMHSNIWAAHGSWQIHSWFQEAIRDGLLLIRPEDGWQAALIASDLVIGDHGSVSIYANALGRPLFFPTTDSDVIEENLTGVVTGATRIDARNDLLKQIELGTESTPEADSLESIDRLNGDRTEHSEAFLNLLYRSLAISSSKNSPSTAPVPTPQLTSADQASYPRKLPRF
jgi:predicted DNA binding CopG/RHH family protein